VTSPEDTPGGARSTVRDVLILGGSGLLGEPAVRAFLAAGARVVVLARGQRTLPQGVEVLRADRQDRAALARCLGGRRFDLTLDLLAYDADDIEALLAVPGFEPGRMIAISTGQVYLVTADPRPPFREEDALRPLIPEPEPGTRDHANWVYGMGKRRMEATLQERCRSRGLPALALRIPIVIGAGDPTGRLWAYVERLLDGGPILVPGRLDQPLRFVWAEDVARLLVTLASHDGDVGVALNWAQPDLLTFEGFVTLLAAELGVAPPELLLCTPPELDAAGLDAAVSPYSSRWCSVLDPSRAEALSGFQATPFATALPQVLAGMRALGPIPDEGYARRAAELTFATRLRSR
jgi:nucleoside-diphosphate-sugar epimerase